MAKGSMGGNGMLECDLVMKGGITSGVIYPKLISTLSETYRFKCIGGTSAGAIAAAAAAAAQLGVHAGTNRDAFKLLEQLPNQLGRQIAGGADSMLLKLFQPHESLKGHFKLLTAALNAPSGSARVARLSIAAIAGFPVGALLGAIPGFIVLAQSWGFGWILGLLLTLLGLVIGALVAAVLSFGRLLPANYFGMCSGMPTKAGEGPPSLTPWLHAYLNQLAGKTGNEPLTFGELWRGKVRADSASTDKTRNGSGVTESTGPRIVELAMMTTALNLGRPYRIPFESGDIYYVEEELSALFPPDVMLWLIKHARPSDTAVALRRNGQTFRAFPPPEDFPVLVGVRLSLSFPILLSALPFYTVDRTLDVNKEKPTQATRVYFSDGGISSNFPVHFFDSPLPSRPTFGVNLKNFHPDHPNERVFLPEMLKNNTGLKNHCPPLKDTPGLGSIVTFIGSILSTMQNWRDHLQLSMPGFRDRIVHISHSEEEGGLNLNMSVAVIDTLADSGIEAAQALLKAFATGGGSKTPNAWDNHRRIRARALLCALQQQFAMIAKALEKPLDPTYEDVVVDETPPSYRFSKKEYADEAIRLLHELQRLSHDLAGKSVDLCKDAPRPAPEVRIGPRV